jgi:sugar phosphate isomerase/epimerase
MPSKKTSSAKKAPKAAAKGATTPGQRRAALAKFAMGEKLVVAAGRASPPPPPKRFQLFKTMWGVPEVADPAQWESLFQRIRADGFDGIEAPHGVATAPFPFHSDIAEFRRLMDLHGLRLVVLVPTCGYPLGADTVDAHIASFRKLCTEAMAFGPDMINSHSGKDSFTNDEAIKFFTAAVKVEKELGIPIAHETHRSRILYSPMAYRDLMPRLPAGIKLTADLSHWAVVCERLLNAKSDAEFWPAVLADVAKRTIHIHARVGWMASAQVADPDAPEHAKDVAAHMEWWDAIVADMDRRGCPVRMEPEFGPYPYLPHLPYTMVPVADLWQLCTKFGRRLQERYERPTKQRRGRLA